MYSFGYKVFYRLGQGYPMRVLRKILKWAGLVLLVLVVAGAIYQQIGLLLDDRLAPPSNDMIAVDGRAVHLVCEGAGHALSCWMPALAPVSLNGTACSHCLPKLAGSALLTVRVLAGARR